MKRRKFIIFFIEDETGAVTTDWVVLTSIVTVIGIMVLTTIGEATTALSESVAQQLQTQTVDPAS